MKKVFLLIIIAFGFLTSEAQFGSAATFQTVAGDTLANVDTVSKVIKATAGYNAIGVQVNVKVLTGTLAGKAYLYKSYDGINYQVSDSASYVPIISSSYNIPTYTHTAIFEKVTVPSVNYRVWAVSTGTVSAPVQISYTLRKDISQ